MENENVELHDVSHYVFRNNPLELQTYVHKEVEVIAADGKKHQGFVQTIDPVSGSVVLVTFDDDEAKELNIIMGHAVRSIARVNEDVDTPETIKQKLDALVKPLECNLSAKEIQNEKKKVQLWFSKHHIPFEENKKGELNIMNALTLMAPYGPQNCISANEIVLGKIQGLLKAMPSDIEQW